MQGARDMSKAYMQSVAEELGTDGWEISAHLNCAPDHQDIQGRQYSDEDYQELNASLARPIGTLNCRHMAFPVVMFETERVYTRREITNMRDENKQGVTYEGKHYTLYEASQQQRKLERSIRKTKRKLIVADEVGDKDDFTAQSIRLRRLQEYYNDFSNKCKLTKREDLLSVSGKKKSKLISLKGAAKELKMTEFKSKPDKGLENITKENIIKAYGDGLSDKVYDSLLEAHKAVYKYGKDYPGYEEAIIVDTDTGRFIRTTCGLKSKFEFSDFYPNCQSMIIVHNHPQNTTLSPVDIAVVLKNPKINAIVVQGNEGSIYAFVTGRTKRMSDLKIMSTINDLDNSSDMNKALKDLAERHNWKYEWIK